MSKDERKCNTFAEISKDEEEEDMSILERPLRASAGSNVQNRLAAGNVGDGSSEPSPDLFRHTSGPRNPISSDMGAEKGQNVFRSSENVQQSAEYKVEPSSNKRNISNTVSGCSIGNKKMRYCEVNLKESSC
ncbi:hypothetical protein CEXT_266021 [Caerostris extrusa]|uniref:Uncharacterized protein n=1 Tax=Caerostris extrusa TaxID=172846 RepID=A0AAV4TYC1_CAEEX|nr:hypothetical protein CEXT_266021 [Caerostris extrusa]